MPYLLRQHDLDRIERERPAGVSSRDVVALFSARGAQLSAATFRKYVQAGLLPRSRRIGRKGKHQGSRGLYPVAVVRRLDVIKRLMAEGLTLEDIRDSAVALRHRVEDLETEWRALVDDLSGRARRHPVPRRRALEIELRRATAELRTAARRIERVGRTLARDSRLEGEAPREWSSGRRSR